MALHTQYGSDRYGGLIAEHLGANNVLVTGGSQDGITTSLARVTLDPGGTASYDFDVRWDPTPITGTPTKVSAVHTGSIATSLEPGASTVEDEIKRLRQGSTISYDPNIRPQLTSRGDHTRETVHRFIALADIVKASEDDIAWIHPGHESLAVARTWLDIGPSIVLVTGASPGAFAVTSTGVVCAYAPPVRVADSIGAGDSFTAGVLAALADRNFLGGDRREFLLNIGLSSLQDCIEFAALCAAVTVSRVGADPPTRRDLM